MHPNYAVATSSPSSGTNQDVSRGTIVHLEDWVIDPEEVFGTDTLSEFDSNKVPDEGFPMRIDKKTRAAEDLAMYNAVMSKLTEKTADERFDEYQRVVSEVVTGGAEKDFCHKVLWDLVESTSDYGGLRKVKIKEKEYFVCQECEEATIRDTKSKELLRDIVSNNQVLKASRLETLQTVILGGDSESALKQGSDEVEINGKEGSEDTVSTVISSLTSQTMSRSQSQTTETTSGTKRSSKTKRRRKNHIRSLLIASQNPNVVYSVCEEPEDPEPYDGSFWGR
eukprot:gene2312-2769_t